MWLFLWFILSVIILGITAWSAFILFQQKRAWKEYAGKNGLIFTSGKLLEPCSMEGVINNFYKLSFFTATQMQEDSRKNRQVTVMQITAEKPFNLGLACGTKEVHLFIQSFDNTKPYPIENEKWDKDHLMRVVDQKDAKTYLTEERLSILNNILKMPNSNNLILMNENEGVFRFETSNPLTDVQKIDGVVKKLISKIEKLYPDTIPEKKLTEEEAPSPQEDQTPEAPQTD